MRYLLCIIMMYNILMSAAQDYEKGVLLFKLNSEQAKPSELKSTGTFSIKDRINQIFTKHLVTSFEQAYPFAKHPELLKIYKIKFNGSDEDLIKELEKSVQDLISEIEQIPIPIATYEPTDYMWYIPTQQDTNGWLWHLKRIDAAKAWDITKGRSDIKIASVDNSFDLSHPDLNAKISPNYDPMSGVAHSTIANSHGTVTASFAAAHTDGGGQLAAIGFNSSMMAYTWGDGVAKALHASNVMHADVITISWFYSCGSATPTETLMINEILDNGTIIVASAGNGPKHCSGGPLGPFTPLVDSRIICVSSVGKDNKHQYFLSGIEKTHSSYPAVSICAPGYEVMGAVSTINADGSASTWPYYAGSGTSQATPIVAGTIALMKSVNKCLTPVAAKAVLQSTADPILDAALYPGQLGAGRLNAYKAVLGAIEEGTFHHNNVAVYWWQTIPGLYIKASNIIIRNGANITYRAEEYTILDSGFEVELGGQLTIEQGTFLCN